MLRSGVRPPSVVADVVDRVKQEELFHVGIHVQRGLRVDGRRRRQIEVVALRRLGHETNELLLA